jgi:hypothetical protein
MNYIPVLTHLAGILFGMIFATGCWLVVFREQDAALKEADEENDFLRTKLAAEKAENENLAGINATLRRWVAEEQAKQQPRDPATGRMLPKMKAVA